MPNLFFSRLLDLIAPRCCVVCGNRLALTEETLCAKCNFHLPRTGYQRDPLENPMAKMLWGQIRVERAAALYYHEPHAETANIIYQLKYKNHPEIGETMGRMMGREMQINHFFDGIDAIVPIPLAPKRLRQRGYNQSLELAKGIGSVTGLPLLDKVVRRNVFQGSQTMRGRWERNDNVAGVFALTDADAVKGRHLLIVDDVITTGATIIACAQQLSKAGDVTFSVLTLGYAKS